MNNLDDLTHKERAVLETLKKRGKPIGEDEYHMINQIIEERGRGLGFSYRLAHWHTINEHFNSVYGATFFSQELHGIIESLIKKGCVVRDSKNPIKIQYQERNKNDNRN